MGAVAATRRVVSASIDRFKVLSPLGVGVDGAVMLCEDVRERSRVAVKSMRWAPPAGELEGRLADAARAIGLDHPGILPVLETGADLGTPFIVFDFLEGDSLKRQVKAKGTFAPVAAIATMRAILKAVAYAHQAGVMHGNLSSYNVLIPADGLPRVADFGTAPISRPRSTNELLAGDRICYLAPERLRSSVLDRRTDVYALGAILFELLTGAPPFATGKGSMVNRVLSDAPPVPSAVGHDAGADMDEIVARALAKDPAARYVDAADMLVALDGGKPSEPGSTGSGSGAGLFAKLTGFMRRVK